MSKRADWLDILVNFISFTVVILVLSLGRFSLPIKIVLAFGLAIAISGGWAYYKRKALKRKTELKRLHVYSVKNVDKE